jgi:hypothetical protein
MKVVPKERKKQLNIEGLQEEKNISWLQKYYY